ncbi:TetR/AcrR family transcriptional regulator [Novosphingobium sp.]|uniref:TetR/AcrR family transcriptional regulator n=1 Tax=Novosphingobium sp. TaxID=1874826 RepID=UPI002621B550|nr:TetR/AcrR family transcriptional regulator [Novosphingobium sp.]
MPIRSITQGELSPVRAARRERLLDAAEALFVAQGFRATSIEGIAEAAGMSKVTLYGYFRDKEAVFAAVAERIADAMEEAVKAALAADAPFPAPLAMALTAKHRIVQARVQRSAFASELLQAKAAHVARRFAALDCAIIAGLTSAMEREKRAPDAAAETARLLFAAANGIANRASDTETLTLQLDRLVRAVISYEPRA